MEKAEILENSIDSNTLVTDLTESDDELHSTPLVHIPSNLSHIDTTTTSAPVTLITSNDEDYSKTIKNRILTLSTSTSTATSTTKDESTSTTVNILGVSTENIAAVAVDVVDQESDHLNRTMQNSIVTQLIEQWKENRKVIDELVLKSNALSFLMQESINPNTAVVMMREKEKENQLLQLLLRQYESTLDIVMKKFRTQTGLIHDKKLREHSDLESALQAEQAENDRLVAENTALHSLLEKCTRAMREALSSIDTSEPISLHVAGYISHANSTESAIFTSQS